MHQHYESLVLAFLLDIVAILTKPLQYNEWLDTLITPQYNIVTVFFTIFGKSTFTGCSWCDCVQNIILQNSHWHFGHNDLYIFLIISRTRIMKPFVYMQHIFVRLKSAHVFFSNIKTNCGYLMGVFFIISSVFTPNALVIYCAITW